MRKNTNKLGFTLIELLVVITIIGILATGAVTVYTSQIQKARDTTRISSIKALQSWVEQVYQDASEYPHADKFIEDVITYTPKLPKDPKHAQPCNDWGNTSNAPDCWFSYVTWPDNNWIEYWEYELSTAFENSWNVTSKAVNTKDWGNDPVRLEIWLDIWNNDTQIDKNAITTVKQWACTVWWAKATNGTDKIIINWNPTTSTDECD